MHGMQNLTKAELLELLKDYKPSDRIGVLFGWNDPDDEEHQGEAVHQIIGLTKPIARL